MSDIFTLNAEVREVAGKGASRRLRREGLIPAIIYGGAKNRKPMSLTLKERELSRALKEEAFYSHVLTINIGDKSEQAILMDIQRSPAKGLPLHADFERVTKSTVVHKRVPLHFINEEKCKAVKLQGGKIQHAVTDVEVTCKVVSRTTYQWSASLVQPVPTAPMKTTLKQKPTAKSETAHVANVNRIKGPAGPFFS